MKKIESLAVCLSLCLLIISLISGCTRLNDNPPTYIKSIVAYKEGADGFMIYFVLADSSGAMTTASGTARLDICEIRKELLPWNNVSTDEEIKLYSVVFNIKNTDFKKTKIGANAFEREAILYPVGRISYSMFDEIPSKSTGKIKLSFRAPYGNPLNEEETITF